METISTDLNIYSWRWYNVVKHCCNNHMSGQHATNIATKLAYMFRFKQTTKCQRHRNILNSRISFGGTHHGHLLNIYILDVFLMTRCGNGNSYKMHIYNHMQNPYISSQVPIFNFIDIYQNCRTLAWMSTPYTIKCILGVYMLGIWEHLQWSRVYGSGFMIHGVWFMLYGKIGCMMYGSWVSGSVFRVYWLRFVF